MTPDAHPASVSPPGSGAAGRRRTVAIVGGGMAGVSLAWLLDGACDVTLLEARNSVGGNVRSVEVELDGHRFVVDMGAQYFHPRPYPVYAALLEHLGLYDPDSREAGAAHPFPASITLTAGSEPTPRFVSPVLPDRRWPLAAPWNAAGLGAFGLAFIGASVREKLDQSWALTLERWLPTLGLSRPQWEGMLIPWAASLFSGSLDQARGLSARAAMIFAARALPPNPLEPISYYVLEPGMIAALSRMLGQCSTVTVLTGARVLEVVRGRPRGFTLRFAPDRAIDVDILVLASSGPPTARLVAGLAGTGRQAAALGGIEFHRARVALHTDPLYAPADPKHWSFLNCGLQGRFCEASMWLERVAAGLPPATAARLWKSWITHRAPPARALHAAEFEHMLPTPATLAGQDRLHALQGLGGLWFAGGYLYPYDSQETAVLSALRIAEGLQVLSARSRRLAVVRDAAAHKGR